MLVLKQKRVLWHDEEECLYAVFGPRRELVEARVQLVEADEAAAQRDASSIVDDVDHMTAELAHLFAAASERLLGGGESLARAAIVKALSSTRAAAKVLRSAVGAVEAVRGASGASAKRAAIARSPDEIEDAQRLAVPIVERELSACETMQRTLARVPLQHGGICGGGIDADRPALLETSKVAARAHVAMERVMAMLEAAEVAAGAGGGGGGGAGGGAGAEGCAGAGGGAGADGGAGTGSGAAQKRGRS